MPHDFLPSREADLVDWSHNFRDQIELDPVSLSLTPAQAAHYASLDDGYSQAFQLSQDHSTRTPAQIVTKDTAKKALKANARLLARIIRAAPQVTLARRVELRLTVPDPDLTPAQVPSMPPNLLLRPSMGRVVRLRLRDKSSPNRRGKPADVAGAAVFSYVGDQPPERLSDWSFEGNMTRTLFDIRVPSHVPAGSSLWIAACWYNTRGKSGPGSAPIKVRVQDGVAFGRNAA